MRVHRWLGVGCLLLALAGCTSGGTKPVSHPSQLTQDAREQAAAERNPLRVLTVMPSGYAGLFGTPSWRTLARSHGDRRLLLEITPTGCDVFLGVTVRDRPGQVVVQPVVQHPPTTSCAHPTPPVVGYVDFPQPLGARLAAASS